MTELKFLGELSLIKQIEREADFFYESIYYCNL